ncbi:hypothetical protein DPMN_151070 [Dreissena polymorpha]|uniref:Uncharacterized protein n=1 Tax=Dreissena polymorpha TaxID=45954 RepID=A0A9D4FGW6_DREPO|nr:hypothetical protein DPMN_151070 [Dreissena polymorpha]
MHVFLVLVVCQVVLCQAQNQTTTSGPMNTTSPTTTSGLKTTIIPTTTSVLETTNIPTTTSDLKTTIIPTTTIVPMTTIIPTTTPPSPTTTTCIPPTPPSVLTDGEGNKYQIVYSQGENMKIYNGSNLVLSVVNSGGLIIEIPAGRDVCIIRDPNAMGDCFDEVSYTGPLSSAAEVACRRKIVVKQIARKCENEAESTRAARAIVANVFLKCCVWIRYPCYPICVYKLHCGKWVCVLRIWKMCQVRFCISGWTGPFVLPGSG